MNNSNFNSFDNYLKSLKKCEFLSAEEERKLIKKAQAGDKKATDMLVKANLRFVVDQAKKMVAAGCNADIEDLIGAGNMGLVKAVSKFRIEKNVRFITCASYWIHAEMSDEAGKTHAIRLPHNCQVLLTKVRAAEASLPKGMGQAEGYEYIAKKVGATKAAVKAILESSRSVASLDSMASDDEDANLYSFLGDNTAADPLDAVIAKETYSNFRKVMDRLPADERKVLETHYGLNGSKALSLDEIARNWDVSITREGIRQKEIKAMRRFHEADNSRYFDGIFDVAV